MIHNADQYADVDLENPPLNEEKMTSTSTVKDWRKTLFGAYLKNFRALA